MLRVRMVPSTGPDHCYEADGDEAHARTAAWVLRRHALILAVVDEEGGILVALPDDTDAIALKHYIGGVLWALRHGAPPCAADTDGYCVVVYRDAAGALVCAVTLPSTLRPATATSSRRSSRASPPACARTSTAPVVSMLRVVTRTSCGRIVEELVHTRLPARYAAPLAALLPEAEHLFGVPIIASSTRRGTVYVGPANAGQQIGPLTVPRMPLLTAWVLGAVTCMRHAAERSA